MPAVGTIALCIGAGVWSEVNNAALQLGVNILGMLVSGTLALLVQRLVWSRVQASKATARCATSRRACAKSGRRHRLAP